MLPRISAANARRATHVAPCLPFAAFRALQLPARAVARALPGAGWSRSCVGRSTNADTCSTFAHRRLRRPARHGWARPISSRADASCVFSWFLQRRTNGNRTVASSTAVNAGHSDDGDPCYRSRCSALTRRVATWPKLSFPRRREFSGAKAKPAPNHGPMPASLVWRTREARPTVRPRFVRFKTFLPAGRSCLHGVACSLTEVGDDLNSLRRIWGRSRSRR